MGDFSVDDITMDVCYECASSVFTADGHIKQVDFAGNTVTLCSVVAGYRAADCIIFVAEKKPKNILAADRSLHKILQLDKNIIVSYAGANPDARVLIDHASDTCQSNRYNKKDPLTVLEITKYISKFKHHHTLTCDSRPFAVSLLIGGYDYDKTGHLCVTEPSGDYYEYVAYAVGRNSQTVNSCLEKNISVDDCHNEMSGITAVIRSLLQANVTNGLEVGVLKYKQPLKFLDARIVEQIIKNIQREG